MKSGIFVTRDSTKQVFDCLKKLPDQDVLVGIPEQEATREDDDPVNNAMLGYIHEFGAPEANIPARPFLVPGVRDVKDRVSNFLKQAGKAALAGDSDKVTKAFHAAGLVASASVKNRIVSGDFQPLAEATLKARARRKGKGKGVALSKGAQAELDSRAAGNAPGTEFAKPLNDTGQMRNAVTYVLRGVKET